MDKYFFVGLVLCGFLFACGNDAIELDKDTPVDEVFRELAFSKSDTCFVGDTASVLTLQLDCNVSYTVSVLEDSQAWITVDDLSASLFDCPSTRDILQNQNKDWIILRIAANVSDSARVGRVVVSNEYYELSDTLTVAQSAKNDCYIDGSWSKIAVSTCGAANLVIMGDGFTKEDLGKNGFYEHCMNLAAEYFFSTEPFKSYRNYFNIYMVVAESEEDGVGEKNLMNIRENKFGSAYGSGTEIVCNVDLVMNYARKIGELPENKPITVIVVLNSTKYAGTTYLYANGDAVALCPMSTNPAPNDFEGIVRHEACGHGFGFLADEYVYFQQEIPNKRKQEIKAWQKLGFQMNLDFTNDSTSILWKDFIGLDKYKRVGAYAGGCEYQYGVWRSEENSCMNNNVPYFNTQSRWSIVNRIMTISEKTFSILEFIEMDNAELPVATRTTSTDSFIPLGNPVWIQ